MRRTKTKLFSAIVIVVAGGCLGAGCGGASEEGSSAEPIPVEQLPVRAAAALCDNIGPCCASAGYAYDAAQCKQTMQDLVNGFLIEPAQRGGAKYDAQAAGECVAWFESAARQCSTSNAPEACDRIFVGTKAAGEACLDSVECAPVAGAEVDCDGAEGQRVCVVEKRGTLGDACADTCTEDGEGVSCAGTGSSTGTATCWTNDGLHCADGSCAALAQPGEACSSDSGCVGTAYCAGGSCQAQLPAGGACAGSSRACQTGLYCAADGTCAEKKPAGAACSADDECDGHCHDGSCRVSGGDFVAPEFCGGP